MLHERRCETWRLRLPRPMNERWRAASAAYNEAVDAAEHTRQQAIRAAEAIKPPRPP